MSLDRNRSGPALTVGSGEDAPCGIPQSEFPIPYSVGENCGVCGVYGHAEAARLIYLGLYALQHRGQESAGIAVWDGRTIRSHKAPGLLGQAVKEEHLADLPGEAAIGHVRYSTTGSGRVQNIQPLVIEYQDGLLAVAHNGNLVNARSLRRRYEQAGSIFQTSTDSEAVVHLLADPEHRILPQAMGHCLSHLRGAFSFVFLSDGKLMAARDPWGWRPLCLGRQGNAWVVASETCALDLLHFDYVRDIAPGELLTIDQDGPHSEKFAESPRLYQCIFEHVYFARPDSYVFGESVHRVRVALGRRLAKDRPADADIVVAVPDSGSSAAQGYSQESGIPSERGFIRNHYVGRTFIMPSMQSRTGSVAIKLNAVKSAVQGKRVVVVDDSIIRGTTSRGRLEQLRRAGAREIHLRISCPPTVSPCYYGVDFPTRTELIAAQRSVEEIASFVGADSLGYQTMDGLLGSVARPGDYCTSCWTAHYPVPPEDDMDKLALERRR